eukprot:COSAG05_NODE_2217_length_3376_cov_61.717410_2_plen_43_part_00
MHHVCCLVGYGLDAVCPRLALEVIDALVGDDRFVTPLPSDVF